LTLGRPYNRAVVGTAGDAWPTSLDWGYGQLQETPPLVSRQGRGLERFLLSEQRNLVSSNPTMRRVSGEDPQEGEGAVMNTKPVYLTAEGLAKLKAELQELVTVDRPRVAARIHEAKLDGDLSENAEYEDAKQEQSFLEGRIATLELQLRNAAVIEKANGDSVGIGSKVVIKGHDGEETFTIVGSAEAAPRDGRISNESPVGVALMGRKKGDKVVVQAPSGPIEYTLVRIG